MVIESVLSNWKSMAILAKSARSRTAGKDRASETIMVVDDERPIRELVAAILVRAGYGVVLAADAREAASIFTEHFAGIDLIISDVRMPGASGHRLIEQLRGIQPRVKCILMSGDAQLAADPDVPLLRKPFSLYQLLGSVAGALRPA